ncbi:DDE superfamily endonuclease [Nitzschia inconspicua]|uniref:DDE superfamily endonuclease n=1 Tax=Nitzschia inconspicua TaxID=303405 RepID=A0A9K3PTY7_9STRA|nr:DDE superfamily endonuclease [Nitzschia inconspicua]
MEENEQVKIRKSRWPAVVLARVDKYKLQTTFYLEELKEMLERKFPELTNSSLPTICLAPNFYLKLTRKVPTKAAARYDSKQYSFPGQLVFIDEISKDGRHAYRRYARSKKGAKVAVKLPWSRGNRVSVLAALNVNGVMAWESIPGTFTRRKFREAFCKNIIPKETHGH